MRKELEKLTTKQLIKLVKTFEHYPAVTLKDGKDYILSYLEDESCTISKKEISEYLLKNGVKINKENIHLYYQYMNEDELFKNQTLINNTLRYRYNEYLENNIGMLDYPNLMSYYINFDFEITSLLKEGWGNTMIVINEIFGIKDILKPINEYITQIKSSNEYKEYRFNNLVKTYDLSISHLKQLEHELFADDFTYISNIDNLIYSALDKIADDFKLNVIDYIEDNYLQESTGLTCISDIEVIIKDGEYQGIFKEFESYGLNDFSVQNITLFVDRYKELKESVEDNSCNVKA